VIDARGTNKDHRLIEPVEPRAFSTLSLNIRENGVAGIARSLALGGTGGRLTAAADCVGMTALASFSKRNDGSLTYESQAPEIVTTLFATDRTLSRSPFCAVSKKSLCFWDFIPIISYMILQGRCKDSRLQTAAKCLIMASVMVFLFVQLYKKSGLSFEFFVGTLFISLLVTVSYIDLNFKVIPDILTIGGIIAGLAAAFFRTPLFFFRDALYGTLAGGGTLCALAFAYRFFAKREGVGGGDIKFLAMIGAFCGLKGVIFSLVAGSFIGSVVGIPLLLLKREGTNGTVPFGPLLSLGALIYSFQGDRFVYVFLNIISGR
jgi:leader peptidase (prepilin peptidase) / N-methyltransferase